MRSKTFRRKNGKMSRRRRAGQPNGLTRQTTAEMMAMEEGRPVTPPPATRPMLGRQNSWDYDLAERGFAATAPPIELMNENEQAPPTLGRSNTAELNAMETGSADVEAGFGSGGRKSRKSKGRKGRKTRKGGKRGRKSHRR
jgi:hypothetical protein